MVSSHFCLSNNSYKNHVFEGFARFQQCDEFVDMTLAAEGCLVKVHQTMIALASPYLKQLIKSVPCQHPVLFLNNVSHELLSFILEYIYTGEVKLPDEKVQPFLRVAQAMHLKGLDNIFPHSMENKANKEAVEVYHETRPPGVEESILINNNDLNLQEEPKFEGTNVEEFIEQTAPIPIPTDIEGSDENNQFVGTIDLSTAVISNSVTINMGNSGPTNIKIRDADTESNLDTNNSTATQDTENIPMIIHHQVSQLATPFLNIDSSAITVPGSNTNNENNIVNDNNSTDFSNLFNVSNEIPLPHDSDLAVDVSISDLLDCNKVATPSTINETENVENIETENVENIETEDVENMEIENVESIETEHVENIETEHVVNIQTVNIINIPTEGVEIEGKNAGSILYTISNRGSLQMIIDRYMYYTHYQAYGGRKRRWRCIDYRDRRCRASMDTDNGVIVRRLHKHCHPNHDKQIWKRAIKNKIFCTLKSVEEIINERKNITNETVVLSDTDDDNTCNE